MAHIPEASIFIDDLAIASEILEAIYDTNDDAASRAVLNALDVPKTARLLREGAQRIDMMTPAQQRKLMISGDLADIKARWGGIAAQITREAWT